MNWKDTVTEPEEVKVFLALDGPRNTWRTIGGIARQTGLSEERVAQILDKYKAIVKGASLPVPFPEQIGDAIAEAGQQVFAVQVGSSSEQLALAQRITDFNTLVVGSDN